VERHLAFKGKVALDLRHYRGLWILTRHLSMRLSLLPEPVEATLPLWYYKHNLIQVMLGL
jgi:hypothetical protein